MGGFEILATVCLSAICATRLVPTPELKTAQTCADVAQARAADWVAARPGYTLEGAVCVSTQDLAMHAAEVVESAPGLFVHFGRVEEAGPGSVGDIANTGFVIGRDGVAVIDSGTSRAVGEALYLAVRQQTDLPIKWLILTHMHPDHVLGADVFREAGANLVGAEKLNRALSLRADPYIANMARLLGPQAMLGTQPAFADLAVASRMELDLGGRVLDLETYETAHTDNDMTVYDRQTRTLWAGDLVFLEHTPALDGSINGWIRALERIETLPALRLVPGHGRLVADLPAGAEPNLEYLRALRQETRDAIARGESLNTALRHLGGDLSTGWMLFDAFNPRNATNAYVELEWE